MSKALCVSWAVVRRSSQAPSRVQTWWWVGASGDVSAANRSTFSGRHGSWLSKRKNGR
jgi:hypothetical protein